MGKKLALVVGVMLWSLAAAQAQQASGSAPYSGLGTGTPGGSFSKPGATAPGADDKQTVPGGSIPMGAATQSESDQAKDTSDGDKAGSSKSR